MTIERLVMGVGVSPKTNLWRCLGAGGVGGSTIDRVMRTQGVSFR